MSQPAPFSIQDDVKFWSRQIAEHQLFIFLGIVQEAVDQADIRQDIRAKAVDLYKRWGQYILGQPTNAIYDLLEDTENFQFSILHILRSGKWIGWLSVSFIQHLNLELEYFKNKLAGAGYNLLDELSFWLNERKTETEATIKLLDPTEKKWELDAKFLIDEITKMTIQQLNEPELLVLSRHLFSEIQFFYDQLGDAIKTNQVETNIHPILVEHVGREGKRAIQIINWFAGIR